MQFNRATLLTCSQATGIVVVIDVLRAFSTTAYAFAAGAREIILTGSVDEAHAIRAKHPGYLLMGEVGGLPIPGFDFGNSPPELASQDLTGRTLIQRTSSGTQGVVRSLQAEMLLASSLVCGSATADYIRQRNPQSVTFVVTGVDLSDPNPVMPAGRGDEDVACADYIEALLEGRSLEPTEFIRRIRESPAGRNLAAQNLQPALVADLDFCTAVDHFNFAMLVTRRDGFFVMEKADLSR